VLSYLLLAPLLAAFGPQLWVLRALTGVAGALTVGALYLTIAGTGARRTALLAALALAGATFAVAYNRLGYTYNLLLLWTATHRASWLWGAVIAAALGWLTDHVGVALPAFVALRLWPRRRLVVVALLAGLLPGLLAAGVSLAWHPDAFLADWRHTITRVAAPDGAPGAAPPGAALARWLVNYLHLLRAEWWWPVAVAGLFCVRPLTARRRLLGLAGLLVVPIFALRELNPFFRTGIPLLLPGAWGVGALLDAGLVAAYQVAGVSGPGHAGGPLTRRLLAALLAALVVILPLGLETGRTAGALVAGFALPIDWALVTPGQDPSAGEGIATQAAARQAAAFVNARTAPTDVVVVSPHVAWLYRARVADFLQAAAAGGQAVAFYPAGLPARRFRFDPTPRGASYAVLDGYWDVWAEAAPPVARLVAEVTTWPLEWQAGDVRVHRQPARGP
jgi:hypothetical protein